MPIHEMSIPTVPNHFKTRAILEISHGARWHMCPEISCLFPVIKSVSSTLFSYGGDHFYKPNLEQHGR